jgi:outer membrane protein OmpA-like peptidoglycan-associated protein
MISLLLVRAAFAVDADVYDPAGSTFDAQGGLQVESATLGTPGDFYAGLQLVYAHDPIVSLGAEGRESYVSDQFGLRLGGGYTIGRAVRLDLDVPIYPVVAIPAEGFEGGAFGDIRIGGLLPVLRLDEGPVGVAFKPFVVLPTGSAEALVSAGGFSAGVSAIAEGKLGDQLMASANLGTRLAPASSFGGYDFGSTFDLGVGLAYLLSEQLRLGAEVDGSLGLAGGVEGYNKNPFELDVYGTYAHESGIVGTLALGTGLVAGVGAPDFRLVAGVGYHKGAPPDKDKDGIEDKLDACKDRPEDVDGYKDSDGCPDLDNDGDGVLDTVDRCPDVAEDTDGHDDLDGCPDPDNDGDGVVDGEDSCPSEAGPEATEGCPDKDKDGVADRDDTCPAVAGLAKSGGCPDADGDGVGDPRDVCPNEPKDPREDAARSDGCPKRVIVTAQRIEMNETVYFDSGKTTIKSQSFALLDEVATVILRNPQIKSIEVGGHTDADGNDAKNLSLSLGRAESVVTYLVGRGVDKGRLTAVGFGETKPIDTNQSETGRARNRRVELVIK